MPAQDWMGDEGNRRLRRLGQIGGRLPPTGLPEGKTTEGTKEDTGGHEGGWGTHLGSAGGEGGRERSAGEARRATGGARKPPAHSPRLGG